MDSEICHVMLAGHICTPFVLMFWTLLQDHFSPSVSYGGTIPVFCSNRNAGLLLALYTLQSLEMDKFASLTDVPPLSALPIYDLYQSTPLTPQHIMPVWPLGERMSLGCSVFWGLTPGMHANAGEKFRRCTSVGDWDWYILFDCKVLQQSDQLLAQKGQSRDTEKQFNRFGLNIYLKSRYFVLSIKMYSSYYVFVLFHLNWTVCIQINID